MDFSQQVRSAATPPVHRLRTGRVVFLFALVLALLAHGRGLMAPLLWDDLQIFDRADLGDLSRMTAVFGFRPWLDPATGRYSPYRPLREVTHTLVAAAFGRRPWAFHLVSLLLHAVNATLVYRLAAAVFRKERPALLASILFATLPAHVEAVTYAKNIAETQALCLALLSVLAALRALQRPAGSARLFGLSILAYAAALLTKESAWPAPLLVAAWLLVGRPRPGRRLWPRAAGLLAPLLVLAVVYAGIQLYVRNLGKASRFVRETLSLSLAGRVELASRTVLGYAAAAALPTRQPPWTAWDAPAGLGPASAGAAALAALALALAARPRPLAVGAYGLWWFLAALAPVSNLAAANTSRPFALQRLYTPSVGFALILGALFAGWPAVGLGRRIRSHVALRRLARAGLAAALVGAVASCAATGPWLNPLRFWRHTVRTCPGTYQAHYNLGLTLARAGYDAPAVASYRASLALRPGNVDSTCNLANALFRLGRTAEAEQTFRSVLRLAPENVRAWNGLAASLAVARRYDEAESAFLKALALDASSLVAARGLVRVYEVTGRDERAVECCRAALGHHPNDAGLLVALGRALARLGRSGEAADALRHAVRSGAGPEALRLLERLDRPEAQP